LFVIFMTLWYLLPRTGWLKKVVTAEDQK
jgi:hypothetical protein